MSVHDEIERMADLYASGGDHQPHHLEQLRMPPHSVEAEQAVLGGLMLVNRAWDDIADLVEEGDFYRRDHVLIFRAIREMATANPRRPFDMVTMGDWFKAQGLLEQVADGAYLIELATTTPSAANIRAYAEIVADKARLRRLIQVGTDIANAGFNPEGQSSIELIGAAQSRVGALLTAQPSESSPISHAMEAAFAELADRHGKGEGMDGLESGFPDFDDILGGFVPGVHFLGGRPKHGKSTLAQNIAEYVALVKKKPVHIVILEMTEKQYAKRMIASVGHVNSQRMRRGTLDEADWTAVSKTVARMRGAPIFITKPGSCRIEHICAQIRRQHAMTPLGLVVLDYLQLVDIVVGKGENYSVAVGRVTRALVNLSQELGIPVICLSQLSRETEKEGRPKPSHLRDSGSIEADAESVIFVYREEVNDPNSRFAGTVEVIVALNRNGAGGSCRLLFNGAQYRCENLPEYWQPAPIEGDDGKAAPRARGFRNLTPRAPRKDVDA
ncbi:replicative DNA helicase [Xanthomonas arboricola pv. corylina]|uniref:replicative DNA helicase n=1 Tax=Xanthomonas arboricola TaxID=56448 RepID=UPI0025B0F8B1|nr:replicative DNA helicase [Xanthomonas arboricola]MDN0202819.1 replicative DNA helicase [Xanthomonas arboricola pv. corylina]MDN0215372.1 replicative DNA helicase [Xanthomonas arboricola pv. corylina]